MIKLTQLFLVLLILCNIQESSAQFYNKTPEFLKANSKWIFGSTASYDKETNLRISGNPGVAGAGASASIADPNTGALLFYTNGEKCWNKNFVRMSNGVQMNNKTTGDGRTQPVCVVPFINENGKYYIFSQNDPFSSGASQLPPNARLFYSVLDMNLDGGLGDIVTGQKAIPLDSGMSSSLIAVPDGSCGIWLVGHALREGKFKAFHITKEGINTEPVISAAGPDPYPNLIGTNRYQSYVQGQLSISPDRTMIAIATTSLNGVTMPADARAIGTILCKFDAKTGKISNPVQISHKQQHSYGLSFSPDNSKLYVMVTSSPSTSYGLYQYSLSNFDSTAIVNSEVQVYTPSNSLNWCYMKLYNDTIYLSQQGTPSPTGMSTISNPNASGMACNFQFMSVSSIGTVDQGLPNEIVYPLYVQDTFTRLLMDTLICSWNGDLFLQPRLQSSDYSYQWDNGSTDTIRKISRKGSYWAKYNDGCQYYMDSFIVNGADIDAVIRVDKFVLSTTLPYNTYQWYINDTIIDGATTRSYTVSRNGDYTVVVTNNEGCSDTSEIYPVTNAETSIDAVLAKQINIYPNTAKEIIYINSPVWVNTVITGLEGKVHLRSQNTNRLTIRGLARGIYLLRIMDKENNMIKIIKIVKE